MAMIPQILGPTIMQPPIALLPESPKSGPDLQNRQIVIEKLGPTFQVDTSMPGDQLQPAVASFSDGRFVVTWTNIVSAFIRGIFGQIFHSNGTKNGSEFQGSTNITCSPERSSIASFSDGRFVVTWMGMSWINQFTCQPWNVYGRLFNADGTNTRSEFLVNYTIGAQLYPLVTSLSDGKCVISWLNKDGTRWAVFGQLFDGNGTINGNEFQVNPYLPGNLPYSSLTNLRNGKFVITWIRSWVADRSTDGIYGQLFNADGTKNGSIFKANTYNITTFPRKGPAVIDLSNGKFVMIWISWQNISGQIFNEDGTKNGLEFSVAIGNQLPLIAGINNGEFVTMQLRQWMNRTLFMSGQTFNADGTKNGLEFQVNVTTSEISDPSVTSFNNNQFVLVWTSGREGSIYTNIYGQLFEAKTTSTSISSSATLPPNPSSSLASTSSSIRQLESHTFEVTSGAERRIDIEKIGKTFQVKTNITRVEYSVAGFSNGRFVVTWPMSVHTGSRIIGQLFNEDGTATGSIFQVNTNISCFPTMLSVASFSNSQFVVTWWGLNWVEGICTSRNIFGQLFNADGTPNRSEFQVSQNEDLAPVRPYVASFRNGKFVISWQGLRGHNLYAQLFNANGTKYRLEQVHPPTGGEQESYSLNSLSNGKCIITWQGSWDPDRSTDIFGQLFNADGTNNGSSFKMNTNNITDMQLEWRFSVTSLSNGTFVILWYNWKYDLTGQIFNEDGTKNGQEFFVSNSFHQNMYVATEVGMVGLNTGEFVNIQEIWKKFSFISAQLFNADGEKYGLELPVYIDAIMSERSVTSLNNNQFVFIWAGRKNGSEYTDIYGQLFEAKILPIRTSSSTSSIRHRFSWVWFLLGGVGAVSCLGLTGYFLLKHRDRKKDGNETFELGKSEQTDALIPGTQYRSSLS